MKTPAQTASPFLLDKTGRPYYAALRARIETLPPSQATVEGRALGAEAWFDAAATSSLRRYRWLNFVQLFLAGFITVISTLSAIFTKQSFVWQITTAVVSASIVVIRGFDNLLPSRNTWVRLRSYQQQLLAERIAYTSRTEGYATASSPLDTYAERVNSILGSELKEWQQEAAEHKSDTKAVDGGQGSPKADAHGKDDAKPDAKDTTKHSKEPPHQGK
jgi:hypothetical protein